jgi:hypothetical protein
MRWANGEAIVEQLLAKGHLQRVQGAQADGPVVAGPGAASPGRCTPGRGGGT